MSRVNSSFEKVKWIVGNKFFHNGVWLYLLQFFNTVIPLVTVPYITRVIGAEYYGIFSKSLNVTLYFQVIVEYGFGMSATREVATSKNNHDEINKIFNVVILSRLLLMIPCLIILGGVCLFNTERSLIYCVLILFGGTIGYCFQQNWLFQGMQDMKYISIMNIMGRTLSTVMIFIFVKEKHDIYTYCLLYIISPIISGLFGFIIAIVRYKLRLFIPSLHETFGGLKRGWYVFTTQFSGKILNIVGITFLGWFTPNHDVGVYSAINKIPNMIVLLWNPISQVLYPISSEKMGDSKQNGFAFVYKVRKKLLLVFGIGILFSALFSRLLVKLAFGVEYEPYYYLLIPQLIFVFVAIFNNFWGCQIMLGGGYDKEYSKCFNVAVVATIFINYVLIRLCGMDGAAFCSLLSECILSILLSFSIRRIKSERTK